LIDMRSLKGFVQVIDSKYDLVEGYYYGLSTTDSDREDKWLFRFVGLSGDDSEKIMSDITYFYEGDNFGWEFHGDFVGVLCDDNEIMKGSIYRLSEKEFREKLNLQ